MDFILLSLLSDVSTPRNTHTECVLHGNRAPNTLLELLVSRRKPIDPLHFIGLQCRHEQVFEMAIPVNILKLAKGAFVLCTKLGDSTTEGIFRVFLESSNRTGKRLHTHPYALSSDFDWEPCSFCTHPEMYAVRERDKIANFVGVHRGPRIGVAEVVGQADWDWKVVLRRV